MATITITYTPAVQFTSDPSVEQIFATWNPANTASDNAVFDGTYYDTNVWDNGEFPYFQSLEAFMASQVAHPGLVAALRAAIRAYDAEEGKGVYNWAATDDDVLYIEELTPALADQGFAFAVGSGS
jgi:hypothetical protein